MLLRRMEPALADHMEDLKKLAQHVGGVPSLLRQLGAQLHSHADHAGYLAQVLTDSLELAHLASKVSHQQSMWSEGMHTQYDCSSAKCNLGPLCGYRLNGRLQDMLPASAWCKRQSVPIDQPTIALHSLGIG